LFLCGHDFLKQFSTGIHVFFEPELFECCKDMFSCNGFFVFFFASFVG
jgi:hypothetical protein